MIYKIPLYKNKIAYIPIVVKNKDVFVGHILCLNDLLMSIAPFVDMSNESLLYSITRSTLDSSRFTGVMLEGVEIGEISDKDFVEKEKEKIKTQLNSHKEHPENRIDMDDDVLYEIDCECGNRVSFKSIEEIPDKDYSCGICERILIQYIGVYDSDIERVI